MAGDKSILALCYTNKNINVSTLTSHKKQCKSIDAMTSSILLLHHGEFLRLFSFTLTIIWSKVTCRFTTCVLYYFILVSICESLSNDINPQTGILIHKLVFKKKIAQFSSDTYVHCTLLNVIIVIEN